MQVSGSFLRTPNHQTPTAMSIWMEFKKRKSNYKRTNKYQHPNHNMVSFDLWYSSILKKV